MVISNYLHRLACSFEDSKPQFAMQTMLVLWQTNILLSFIKIANHLVSCWHLFHHPHNPQTCSPHCCCQQWKHCSNFQEQHHELFWDYFYKDGRSCHLQVFSFDFWWPIIGKFQKGKPFQGLMSMTYNKFIKNQFGEDKHNYNRTPESLKSFMLILVPYQQPSRKPVSTHFKKFLPSSWNWWESKASCQ